MSRLALIAVLALAVAACSTPGSSESSTTIISGVSSSPSTTTSSTVTTTTSPPITTTALLLEGNWAEEPIVTSVIATLGWWDGTQWIQAENGMDLPVSGGEDYQVALLGGEPVTTKGGPRVSRCDIHTPSVDYPGVELADSETLIRYIPDDPSRMGAMSGVAISAPWELTPRPVNELSPRDDLEEAAVDLLVERDFETDGASLVQVVDTDLDGDGSKETIVVAETTELTFDASSGVYSIVFAVSPAWEEPRVIVDDIIPLGEKQMAEVNRIGAVADLSGDGRMEVVISGGAYESNWNTVYELTDTGFVDRISSGCGV